MKIETTKRKLKKFDTLPDNLDMFGFRPTLKNLRRELSAMYGPWGIRIQKNGMAGIYWSVDWGFGKKCMEIHREHLVSLGELLKNI